MSIQSFLINNGERNPNEFIAKIGRSVKISENSEICVNKLSLRNVKYKSVNSSNDTFVIMWGQNNLENSATDDLNNNQTNFMPAETIKLEHGAYKMYGELNVIDDLFTGQDIDYDNIARNLVKSIMEQSKYFMWGWGVKFSNTGIGIMAYLRNRNAGYISFNNSTVTKNNMDFEIIGSNPGVSPSYTEIFDRPEGFACVGAHRVPFPYDAFIQADTPNNPRTLTTWRLSAYNIDEELIVGFGGYILEEQEYYKNTESYNIEKDWIGIKENFDQFNMEPDGLINQIPISWEIRKNTDEIIFVRRQILNGSVGNIVETFETGIIYDGVDEIYITFQPNITPNNPAATDTNRFVMNCLVGIGAAAQVLVGVFVLDRSYVGMNWRNALCWSSLDETISSNGVISVDCFGIDESKFINNSTQSLGPICGDPVAGGGFHLGNISATIFMTPIKSGTELSIIPVTVTNYEMQKFTEKCNCNIFQEEGNNIYNIDDEITEANMLELDVNYDVDGVQLSLNIDNLPITNYICNPENGKTQKRIFTLMLKGVDSNADYSSPVVIEPNNLNWNKLNNTSPIVINNFQIRFSNLDGSTSGSLESNVDIELLIRSNRQNNYRAIGGVSQKIETTDQTENNFKISQNMF